ncbi:MAG TPA: MoaD/ThiS family protein [Dokdonella sp.]|uniref:MoaD/ThiS family protein n=1 Tax=Dokdonella sp. TaxID=2291710 RepID=UPI0025C6AC57|nr:MoaD/ThiS family protein [Dokdonella sp.]MBX3693291.1 MoaD/ThiS family protein [Dokdonella sp.]MCW5567440.1 MoaD/ThiS family protein [Dokdonella sp.]HNR92886.1 MoaD/ThiS family protein [Dokdonella sp.]
MKYRLLYFASLADRAGCDGETLESAAADPAALYAELAARHGFVFAPERLRVAVNGAFAAWTQALADGDEIVFVPPVSGG